MANYKQPLSKNLQKRPTQQWQPATQEDHALVGKLLGELIEAGKHDPVTSDEELQARLEAYFERCAREQIIPTVEEMGLWTGYTEAYWNHVKTGRRQGFSVSCGTIWEKALAYMKGFDAKLVISGKMNFLVYCFRAKNFYGMQDKVEFVPAMMQPTRGLDAGDIAKRYLLDAEPADEQEETDA